jgi:kynureninase
MSTTPLSSLFSALPARAAALDDADALKGFRARFAFPRQRGPEGERDTVYLVGNSLGLMPLATRDAVVRELDAWAALGVDGHFRKPDGKEPESKKPDGKKPDGKKPDANATPAEPWFSYHALCAEPGARLVGALPHEVVAMGSLTANLHMLMVSFYRPTAARNQIVIEGGAFPSDRWAVHSQARFHGHAPEQAVVELTPRPGEDLLRTDDVLRFIDEQGDRVALFLMGGVNYYTGQRYDIRAITKAAKKKGIVVGWDLAHAAGNVPLSLHDDDVDFAAWCSYKYLNSGPGSVAMAFVHERHQHAFDLPRFVGWWSSDPNTRFQMASSVTLQPGAAGWQVSNAPVLSMAALSTSLRMFDEAGMHRLRHKSEALTGFLLEIVDAIADAYDGALRVITPRDPAARGAQLSLRMTGDAERFLRLLEERGVRADFRRPDVIRVAPAPLYNSFADVAAFGLILRDALAP